MAADAISREYDVDKNRVILVCAPGKGGYGGPRCLDQRTTFITETGGSQALALAGGGSGAANRSGAAAPTRSENFSTPFIRTGSGPATRTLPRYTSHGVSYSRL